MAGVASADGAFGIAVHPYMEREQLWPDTYAFRFTYGARR